MWLLRYRSKPPAFLYLLAILLILSGCFPEQPENRSVSSNPTATSPGKVQANPLPLAPASTSRPRLIPSPTYGTQPVPPNILFFLTDDQDAASLAYMPAVQKLLVQQGSSFSNYIVNISLCCPSRATILTGMYGQNSGIVNNRPPDGGFETFLAQGLENQTIAVDLRAAGYRTGFAGKYLNGYPNEAGRVYIPPGWDEWYVPVSGNPYDEYSYELNENGKIKAYQRKAEHYLTDVLASKAEDFILRNPGSGQPFFLIVSSYAPHGPSIPAPRHRGLFTDYKLPPLTQLNEEDIRDKPGYIQELTKIKQRPSESLRRLTIRRLQSLQAVDEMVSRLVSALETTGQLDNTYIVYSSDNGFHLGQHRLRPGKSTPYEEDIRVPLVMRGPGITPGQVITQLAGNADLAPTFASLAGMRPRLSCDGRSLLPLLSGAPPREWRGAYPIGRWTASEGEETGNALPGSLRFAQFSFSGLLEPPDEMELSRDGENTFQVPPFTGLRGQNFVYVEYVTGEREYYDLKADPLQEHNLAASLPTVKIQILSAWLSRLSTCHGEVCRITEQIPAGFTP